MICIYSGITEDGSKVRISVDNTSKGFDLPLSKMKRAIKDKYRLRFIKFVDKY